VAHNTGLCFRWIKEYNEFERQALSSELNLGLFRAFEKHDISFKTKFSTYATWWIKSKKHRIAKRQNRTKPTISLEAPIRGMEGTSISSTVHDPKAQDPSDLTRITNKTLGASLTKALSSLKNNRDQVVLRLLYGLDGSIPKTLQEVGQQLGVTRSRVRQIEVRALKLLKSNPILSQHND